MLIIQQGAELTDEQVDAKLEKYRKCTNYTNGKHTESVSTFWHTYCSDNLLRYILTVPP